MIWLITFVGTVYGIGWLIAWTVGLLRNGSFTRTREEFRFLSEELQEQKRRQKLQNERDYQELLKRRKEHLGW